MKNSFLPTVLFSFFILLFIGPTSTAQVGIGTTNPTAKLDVVNNENLGTLRLNQTNASSTPNVLLIQNAGTGRALNIVNSGTSGTLPLARFYQSRTNASGILLEMDNGSAATGIRVSHFGTGGGLYTQIAGGSTYGVYNNLTAAGGLGSYSDLGSQDGIGFWSVAVDNPSSPTSGGDAYGFMSDVMTTTPSGGGVIHGATFVGRQYGVGHGILQQHHGTQGRSAEITTSNSANADPTILAYSSGSNNVITAINDNDAIVGQISVGNFAYTGNDLDDHVGVSGYSNPGTDWGIGVYGLGGFYGIVGEKLSGSFGSAIHAIGNTTATGTKNFISDHPLDPANKILKHFSIESDEVLNMYRGVAQLDGNGKAIVALPDYFEAINRDVSYQLTSIGSPQQPYISKEVLNNEFEMTGAPGAKVSWLIIAERHDAYLKTHPESREPVVEKVGDRRGKYFNPEYYGLPKEMRIDYRDKPAVDSPSSFTTPAVPKPMSEE